MLLSFWAVPPHWSSFRKIEHCSTGRGNTDRMDAVLCEHITCCIQHVGLVNKVNVPWQDFSQNLHREMSGWMQTDVFHGKVVVLHFRQIRVLVLCMLTHYQGLVGHMCFSYSEKSKKRLATIVIHESWKHDIDHKIKHETKPYNRISIHKLGSNAICSGMNTMTLIYNVSHIRSLFTTP